jgi:hypothetical protein
MRRLPRADSDEQARSGCGYQFSVYQVEYSRNLIFRNGAQMQRVFDAVVDRTRSRLDVPRLKTLFGFKTRPHRDRAGGPPRLAAVIETPVYDLTIFKLHFGALTLKAYTKGEHVLRFEAVAHNTRELRCGRVLERFPDIVARLAAMAHEFCTAIDCVDVGFIADGILEQLPAASQLGATRVGGVDLNKPRMRYVARVRRSPVGETSGTFTLPFIPEGLENVVLRPGCSRTTVRRIASRQDEMVKGFGSSLYNAVFAGEVGISLRRSIDEAAR